MKFILHQYFTNNGVKLGEYKHPTKSWVPVESDVRITDRGITFFNTPVHLTTSERIAFAQSLECKLVGVFRHGFSAISTAVSDNSVSGEMVGFFDGVGRIIPHIKTIFASSTKPFKQDEWIGLPERLNPDLKVDWHARNPSPADQIVQIVGASDADCAQPLVGWNRFEETLERLHRESLEDLKM